MNIVRDSRTAHGKVIVVTLTLALLAASCTGGSGDGGSEAEGEFVLGISNDLTGPFSVNGVPATAGVRTAVALANKAGGIDGHQVRLIVRDDQSDASRGLANVREFANAEAVSVVGTVSSVVIAAVLPSLERFQMPLVGVGVPSDLLDPVTPYIFNSGAAYNDQARAQVEIINSLSGDGSFPSSPRLGALHLATPAGEAWLDAVESAAAEEGLEVVETESVQPTAASYGPQVTRLMGAQADVILTFVSTPGITAMASALTARGTEDTHIVNFDITTNEQFMSELPWDNFLSLATYDITKLLEGAEFEEVRTAANEYEGGDPGSMAFAQGYAAGQLVLEGLEACGFPCGGEQLKESLETLSTDLNGLGFGELRFTTENHAAVSTASFYRFEQEAGLRQVGEPIDIGG